MDIPVFLMCFANDRKGNHLRGIASEQDGIWQAFKGRQEMCKLEVISDLNPKKLVDAISEYNPM